MIQQTIYVRATRAAVRRAIARAPAVARGGGTAASAIMARCGLAALGRIKRAFVTKARGGTDEAGDSWPPLSPYTIARRRVGSGAERGKGKASTQVEILRDTGLLLNSLSPGVSTDVSIFRVINGEVVFGTNRKWAWTHHRGLPSRHLPQRRLWPDPSRWPSSWWLDILEQLQQGLLDIVVSLIKEV